MSEEDRIAQALELVKAGRLAEAQEMVAEVIRANRNYARAWILMAKIVDDPEKALQCWEQVARLKPDDPRVQQEIALLKGEPVPEAQPVEDPPTIPQPQPMEEPPGVLPAQPPVELAAAPLDQLAQPPVELAAAPVAQPAAPLEQKKRKSRLPWLIGGVVLLVVVGGVAFALSRLVPPSEPASQAQVQVTAGPVEPSATQDMSPDSSTTTEEPDQPADTSTSATATTPGASLPTANPTGAAGAPTATSQPISTNTPLPGDTPASQPTTTPLSSPATQAPTPFKPGKYLVGTDIKPGIYRGEAASNSVCYWGRYESETRLAADNNSIGQFYVEVRDSDYALETACDVVPLASVPANTGGFPQTIKPGMYLVGRDIQPGNYQGQGGDDFPGACYWERLSNVTGELDAIIDNDFVEGQFNVQVAASDFALTTTCDLTRMPD